MKLQTRPLMLTVALMGLLIFVACGGGDDDNAADPASTAAPSTDNADSPTATETSPQPGRILVSSSTITGQKDKLLIVFGPANTSEFCARIDSDSWSLTEAPLTDRDVESDPCSGVGSETLFEPGQHFLTASLVTPGDTTGATTAVEVALVDGDVSVEIDGSKLAMAGGDQSGDAGRILVTSSKIEGHKGKLLIVLAQGNDGSTCALIDSDSWSLPKPTAMTETPGENAGPCGEGTPEVTFAAGDNVVTASIFVPGETAARATVQVLVKVDGDVTAAVDGGALSAP